LISFIPDGNIFFWTYQISENIVRVGAVAIFRSKCSFFQNVFKSILLQIIFLWYNIMSSFFCKLLKQGLLQKLCVKSVKTWWSVEHLIQWSKPVSKLFENWWKLWNISTVWKFMKAMKYEDALWVHHDEWNICFSGENAPFSMMLSRIFIFVWSTLLKTGCLKIACV